MWYVNISAQNRILKRNIWLYFLVEEKYEWNSPEFVIQIHEHSDSYWVKCIELLTFSEWNSNIVVESECAENLTRFSEHRWCIFAVRYYSLKQIDKTFLNKHLREVEMWVVRGLGVESGAEWVRSAESG